MVRGSCDGTHQGKRYFTCPNGCGLFVTLEQLSPVAGEESEARTPTLEREVPAYPLREARKSYENLQEDPPPPPVPQKPGKRFRVIRTQSEDLSPQHNPQRVFKVSPRHQSRQSSTSSESYEEVEIDFDVDDDSSPPPVPPHHPPPPPDSDTFNPFTMSTSSLPPLPSRSPPLTPVPVASPSAVTRPEASSVTVTNLRGISNQSVPRECSTPENHSKNFFCAVASYMGRKPEYLVLINKLWTSIFLSDSQNSRVYTPYYSHMHRTLAS